MKIQIEQSALLAGLQRVMGVVERRNTLPVLSHILMTAHPAISGETRSQISIFATDLEIGVRDSYPARILLPGQIVYPARRLLEITRTLAEGMVEIEEQENHWVSIQSGNAFFKVACLPPEQFPAFPPSDTQDTKEIHVTVDADILSKMIRKTVFAAGENDARYILNGVLVQIQVRKGSGEKEVMRFVATDGHRLALVEDAVQIHTEDIEEENMIVPRKGMLEIKRLLDTLLTKKQKDSKNMVEFLLGSTMLTVRHGESQIFSRFLQGNYPKYQQVIPQACEKKVEVAREAILGALARVSALSEDRTALVEIHIQPEQILFCARAQDCGEASESVPTSFHGDKMTIKFPVHHLYELLSLLDDDPVVLELKDEESACMIRESAGREIFVLAPSVHK